MSSDLSTIFIDTEWGFQDGKTDFESAWVPVVLCALSIPSGQEYVFLPGRDDQRLRDFLNMNEKAVFVAHSITAEMKYLLRLGMSIPDKWYDTLLAERWLTNSPLRPEVSLVKALERRDLSHLIPLEKKEIRQKILTMNFSPGDSHEMDEIIEYCMRDYRASAALFRQQRIDPENRNRLDRVMSWWPIYQLAVAKMELRGIPFDVATYRQIVGNWTGVRESLANEVNVIAPVMTPSGINRQAFGRFCKAHQIPLPRVYDKRTHQMRYSIENEALKEIEHCHSVISQIRETQKTLIALRNNRMVVDFNTGRHYYDVIPFGTVTGRNAPRQFIFNQSKWMRFLVVPESPDHVLVYVDYDAQEIGIAAALSRDPAMQTMYQAEDPHTAFAELAGAVPTGARKDDYPEVRKKYKVVNL